MDPSPSTQTPQSPLPQAHPKTPQFPPHKDPRVWFLTDGLSPIAISLSRHLLRHGDSVVAGILPGEFQGKRGDGLRAFMEADGFLEQGQDEAVWTGAQEMDDDDDAMDVDGEESDGEESGVPGGEEENMRKLQKKKRWRPWNERFKVVALDGRYVKVRRPLRAFLLPFTVLESSHYIAHSADTSTRVIGQCQSAIAEAILAFSQIDVLVICQSEALIGSIEELSQSDRALSLVRDQFETNFFAPVNLVKAVLPGMREKRNGHIVAITGISAFPLIILKFF
jgi:NAD(P)-dependent dehydrogenase (short-subunit alcohol dehydrogenase family)